MKVAVFSTKSYDRQFLEAENLAHDRELLFLEPRLTYETAHYAIANLSCRISSLRMPYI